MQEASSTTWHKRVERPYGVYFLTIYDFLLVGLLPLLTFVLYMRQSAIEMSLPAIMLPVGLYVLVMAFSVWAFVGDNIARWLLLSAVTLTVVVSIIDTIFVVANTDFSAGQRPNVVFFVPRSVLALAVNWWYFNRQGTVAYYKRDTPAA